MNIFDRIKNSHSSLEYNPGLIKTVDMHTGGEPLRVIIDGLPEIEGKNVLDYRRILRDKYDSLRTLLMHEPRGHSDMYGVYLVPPNDSDAHFGAVFIHNEGYSTMCGHAIIALAKLAVQSGWVTYEEPYSSVVIDAPCGRIAAKVWTKGKNIERVEFEGVPSYVVGSGIFEHPERGDIPYTIAYGGAYYAYVHAPHIGLNLHEPVNELIKIGMEIKNALINGPVKISHPFEADLSFLYGTIFTGGKPSREVYDRNICIFADGEVDRSPTGSGVSGRMAILNENNLLNPNEVIEIESITHSVFETSFIRTTKFGSYKAVIPLVSGKAYITGYNTFYLEEGDEFSEGFLLH